MDKAAIPNVLFKRGILAGRLSISDVAFLFWFLIEFRLCFIFIFFRNNPALGSVVSSSAVLLFAYFLLTIDLSQGLPSPAAMRHPAGAKLIGAYIMWSGCSLLWTCAESITSAFGYWLLMASEVVVIAQLFRLGDAERVTERSLQGIVAGSLGIAVVAIFSGATAGFRMGDADFLHPNSIGKVIATGCLCALYLTGRIRESMLQKFLWGAAVVLLTASLLRSLSKGAIVGFLVAVAAYILMGKALLRWKVMLLLILSCLIAAYYHQMSGYLEAYSAAAGGRTASTLSGRTVVWAESLKMIKDHPLKGHGFLSFRAIGPGHVVGLITAHNEWLQQWFSLGAVGLLLSLLIYINLFRSSLRARADKATLSITLLAYMLTNGFVDAYPTGLFFPLPLLLTMLLWLNS
jgi:O-antigen ligase